MKLKYTLVFTIISFFIATAGFAQTYTDQEIGFDAARFTAALKEHGINNENISSELARLRDMKLIQYKQIKKEEQASELQKLKTQQFSKSSLSKLAANEITEIPASEKAVLKALYDNNGGENWVNKSGWDFNTPVTSWDFTTNTGGWYGITVSGGHVVGIRMVGQNLTGILPDLSPLTYLYELNLASNNLTPQNIPHWLTNLPNLERLTLGNSNFNGDFPNFLSSMTKLTHLELYQNDFNESVMPSWFTQLPNLFSLEVFDCKFKGPIPDLSSLNKLRYLSIGFADFSNETIPLWLNNMPQLFDLDISVSNLKGELPDLSNLTNLYYFDFSYNQLTGPIPNYFNNFPNLNYISLHNNKLTGPLPEVSNLKNLRQLSFSDNQITGSIPELSGAINLQSINFSNNKLTGVIPDLSNLNLTFLRLNFNQLSGPIPNLKPTPNLGYLEMGSNQLTGTLPDLSLFTGLYGIDFSFNKLTGSIPSYSSITNLNTLRLDNNQFSGHIPSLTSNTALTFVSINHNKFRFVDFIDQFNFLNARSFGHFPQATIDEPQSFDRKSGETVTLKMCLDDVFDQGDTFQWYHNGQEIYAATSRIYTITDLRPRDSGTYTCVSNHNIPGMRLALSRYPITLNVTCADIPNNIKMDKEEAEIGENINFSFDPAITGLIYYWNFYDSNHNFVSNGETISTTTKSFNAPGIYTLELTVDQGECRTEFIKTFTIKPKPCVPAVGTINTSTQNILVNSNILFSFEPFSTSSTYKWTFYNLDNSISYTSTFHSAYNIYNTPGTYNVNLLITDQNGCTTNLNKQVIVNERPPCVNVIGTILPSSNNLLTNKNTTFSFETTSQIAGYRWLFYKSDGSVDFFSPMSTVEKTYAEPGNYNISLVVTDTNQCTTSFNKTVSVISSCIPINGAIKSLSSDIIVGQNVEYFFETTATNLTYEWTLYTGSNSSTTFTTSTANMNYDVPGNYNIKLVVTDSNGCKNTFNTTVVVNCVKIPGEIKTANPVVTQYESTTFSFETTATNLRYDWTFHSLNNTPLLVTSESNPTVTYPYNNSYKVTLRVYDENDCATEITKYISVQKACPPIIASITSPATVATNEVVRFGFTTNYSSIGYQWTFYNLDGSVRSTSMDREPSKTFTSPGVYRINLELTDFSNYGCKTSIDKTVTVTGECSIPGTMESNPGEAGIIYNQWTSFRFDTSASDLKYEWTITKPNSTTPEVYSDRYAYNYFDQPGIHKIALKVSDNEGCSKTIEKTYTIQYDCRWSSYYGYIYNTENRTYALPNTALTYQFYAYSGSPNFDEMELLWEFVNSDGEVLSTANTKDFNVTPTTIGNYTIKFKTKDKYGCTSEFGKELYVQEPCEYSGENLDGFIGYENENIADLLTIQINQTKELLFTPSYEPYRLYSYRWKVYNANDELVESGNNDKLSLTLSNPGLYKIKLEIENESGCILHFSKSIKCLIENSCTNNNAKSQIVRSLYFGLLKNLISRSLSNETDEHINASNSTKEYSSLKPYITNRVGDKIYNYTTIRNEQGKLTSVMFSFSPDRDYDVQIFIKKGLWNYDLTVDGTLKEFANRFESELYLDLSQYTSSSDYLISCYVQDAEHVATQTVQKTTKLSTTTSSTSNDCYKATEVRFIDFCPTEACVPTDGVIQTGNALLLPPVPPGQSAKKIGSRL
ncbi:PKD domain-containing protein [Flavobacterium sp. 3-210]